MTEKGVYAIILNFTRSLESFIRRHLETILAIFVLSLIIYLAFFVRLKTANTDIPLDYDPWFFFRHAKEIVETWDRERKFIFSAWDVLSYFPPGRPVYYDGYSYTLAISYILFRNFINISLEKFSVYFVAIYAALCAIPAFFLTRFLTKSNLAGLLSAFLITLSPAFLLVSMAGYVDSDVVYVFYTYLAILSTLLLFQKFFELKIDFIRRTNIRKIIFLIPYILFVIISYILFAWNWNSAYYFLQFFFFFLFPSLFIPTLLEITTIFFIPILNSTPLSIFLIYVICFFVVYLGYKIILLPFLKSFERKKGFLEKFVEGFIQGLNLGIIIIIPLILVEIITFVVEISYNTLLPHPFQTILSQYMLAIKGGLSRALLVNVSVAELQSLDLSNIRHTLVNILFPRVGVVSGYSSILFLFLLGFVTPLLKFLRKEIDETELFLSFASFFIILLLIPLFLNVPAIISYIFNDSTPAIAVVLILIGGFIYLTALVFSSSFLIKIIDWKELFLGFWLIINWYLVLSQGIRFSLLFATCLAIISSYTLLSIYNILREFLRKFQNFLLYFDVIFFSFLLIFSFYYLDSAFKVANAMKGMEIDSNWRAALDFLKEHGDEYTLVATWWDPGHIIAGYTGLKVHADGAHCGWDACIPYNHDIRIQDMGRILTTSNETEAYEILKKYTEEPKEYCSLLREKYSKIFDENVCNIKIKKIYFIASQDLIFKYYWPYYFSSCLRKYYPDNSICYTQAGIDNFFYKNKLAEGKAFNVFYLNLQKSNPNNGILVYSTFAIINNQQIQIDITIKQETVGNQTILVPYLMNRDSIRYLVYYSDGTPVIIDTSLYGKKPSIKGMVILDPSLQYLFFAEEDLANSMFTKMFFLNGLGLEKFKLVFNNPEVKIYEVDFE